MAYTLQGKELDLVLGIINGYTQKFPDGANGIHSKDGYRDGIQYSAISDLVSRIADSIPDIRRNRNHQNKAILVDYINRNINGLSYPFYTPATAWLNSGPLG